MHTIFVYVLVNLLTGSPVILGCDTAHFPTASACETARAQFTAGVETPRPMACRRIEIADR